MPESYIVWDEKLKDFVVKGEALQGCIVAVEDGEFYGLLAPSLRDRVIYRKPKGEK